MSDSALHARIAAAPLVHDRERAASVLADLARRCGDEPELAALGALIAEPPVRDLLAGIFGASPYLTSLIERHPASLLGCALHLPGRALRRAHARPRCGRRSRERPRRSHARAAPVQDRHRASHRTLRSGRRLAGDDGHPPPVGGRRRGCDGGGELPLPPGRQGRRLARRRPCRLHRARHGQIRRLRAQLLLRHRSHRLLRPRPHPPARRPRSAAHLRAHHPRSRPPAQRTHRRRLRVPHRSEAQARPRRHAACHLDQLRARLLRERRPELGARRPHQGAARRRRPRRGPRHPGGPRPLYLAQVPGLCGHRRHPRHEAADPRLPRLRPRSASPATTSRSAAAASARSSSSCRPSS